MSEIEKLVVKAEPQGVDDTAGEFAGLEENVAEITEGLSDQGDEMQAISQRWNGALTAITTGLAVASAGLLSQVPVVGGVFDGLKSIISAVAYQMDQVLRPILQPITNKFYEVSASIYEADGALGTIIGVVASVIAILGTIVGAIVLVSKTLAALAGAKAAVIAAGKLLISAITALVGALSLPVVAIAAVVAALGLLVWYFRDEIASAISTAIDWLVGFAGDLKDTVAGLISDAAEWGSDIVDKLAEGIKDAMGAIEDWIGDAKQWGKDIIKKFVEGIKSKIGDVKDAAGDVKGAIEDKISFDQLENDRMAQRWGQDLMQEFSAGVDRGQGVLEGALDAPQAPEAEPFLAGGREEIAVMLDGRRVDEGVREYRGEEGNRRGRF